ncbi:TetR/AcrR family transcriptional regulator [Chromobacterium sp. IIBBL 290-4]|uniref:TetR/AcrR family transcriptional regulator n=1 Tax=Chromobacterium sp. IIBBL 290-4 TaxID=2953890 RepID=UPI0020B8E2C6|nr:TetR/AcrR family transcriptional regulator [Chromobacterium sp. IIBBL 290-4]UTH75804.1 TetR/AcrR family transcriptional regulator [Chromobacterium sp. IIBBL 290-4]
MRPKEFEEDAVAEAAMRVFWQRGYAATSIQDLVDGTGLSRSSLYNAFDSKQGLYLLALRRYGQVGAANAARLAGTEPLRERLRALLMRVVEDEALEQASPGCLAANAALEAAGRDEAVNAALAQHFQQLETALLRALAEARASGELAANRNQQALARFLMCAIQGLRVLGKGMARENRRAKLAEVVEVALSCLD